MAPQPILTRRDFLATSSVGLASVMLSHAAYARSSTGEPLLRGIVTLPNSESLLAALRAEGIAAEWAAAEALLLFPSRLKTFRGERLLHIGSAADQVLVGLALDSRMPTARPRLRSVHSEPVPGAASIHGIELLAGFCADGLAGNLRAAGCACRIQGSEIRDEADEALLFPTVGVSWQTATLTYLVARARNGRRIANAPLRWHDAPATFSMLIADI